MSLRARRGIDAIWFAVHTPRECWSPEARHGTVPSGATRHGIGPASSVSQSLPRVVYCPVRMRAIS